MDAVGIGDGEDGRVRRLKPELGFAPLPSARDFAALPVEERRRLAQASFAEQRAIGIDFDLAPVIDADTNPDNPNIGAIERAFSPDLDAVRENAVLLAEVAAGCGLQLCLKHFQVTDVIHALFKAADVTRSQAHPSHAQPLELAGDEEVLFNRSRRLRLVH